MVNGVTTVVVIFACNVCGLAEDNETISCMDHLEHDLFYNGYFFTCLVLLFFIMCGVF